MIVLTKEMRRAVDTALADDCPVISASVGGDGQPSLAFFGSTQVHGDDQLAIWVRNPEGGFLRRIAANPRIALLYRNPEAGLMWQFHGRARVAGGGSGSRHQPLPEAAASPPGGEDRKRGCTTAPPRVRTVAARISSSQSKRRPSSPMSGVTKARRLRA